MTLGPGLSRFPKWKGDKTRRRPFSFSHVAPQQISLGVQIGEQLKMESSQEPGIFRYVLGFLVVGFAWGFTTPFMRRAALQHPASPVQAEDPNTSWALKKLMGIWHGFVEMVSRPSYTIPLVVNLSGSAMFFLIVGQAGLSTTDGLE
jgi:hypothetical protein